MEHDIFTLASWIGGIAFALSGYLAGTRKGLDVMGVFIVTMLTANGGGAVRDVLINRTPLILTDLSGFYLVVGVFVLATILKLYRFNTIEKAPLFVISDAIGLVAFSVTGAIVGIEAELNIFGVMVLAFVTATGGGIIRDLMVNEVPSVLSSDFYGTVAVLVGLSLFGLNYIGFYNELVIGSVLAAAILLRLAAYIFGWRLPHIKP